MSGEVRAFFLDRDGTINEDRGYVHRIEEFIFLPGAVEAIKTINRHNCPVVVVTNQSGVARGYYARRELEALHCRVNTLLSGEGAYIDAFYYCPHHPDERCCCRKPRPGMLLRAAFEMGIDLGQSFMIGDKISDVQAGLQAGCQSIIINSAPQELEILPGVTGVRSLLEAVRYCLGGWQKATPSG